MIDTTVLINLAVAIALGTLIGLEREYSQIKKNSKGYGGIRTFPLIALVGAMAGFLGDLISPQLTYLTFGAVATLIIISHYFFSKQKKRIGVTTEMAGLATFLIGLIAYKGFLLLAIVLGIIITVLLYTRPVLHKFAAKITKEEILATLKFAIIAFVILPIIPKGAFGPLDAFNPRIIWLMVVFVSGISFLGYILIKYLGDRGTGLAGFLGGFVSSTATTLSLAERSKKINTPDTFTFGVVAANAAMMIKVLILVFILDKEVFLHMLKPIGGMIILSGIMILVARKNRKHRKHYIDLKSPFTLGPAIKFAIIFGVILFAVKASATYFSSSGAYAISFIAGLVDADATVLSALQLTGNINLIAGAASLAIVANTISKSFLAFAFGERVFAHHLLVAIGAIAILGAALIFFF